MTDAVLLAKIKKLAEKMEENTLLDYEMSGYMHDKTRRDIFRHDAKHRVLVKKKLAYIDQMNGADYGSGKLLVSVVDEVSKTRGKYPKGSVFSIKAYGQKNRYLGDVDKQIKEFEDANATLTKAVMERALKNAKMR